MAGITRYDAERIIKQVFEEYITALKTAAHKKEYLKAEAFSLFAGMEAFETFTTSNELTELYSALNTDGIRQLFRISMALAYLYQLPSYKKYRDSLIEYQKIYKIKVDSVEYIGEEKNIKVEEGRTVCFHLERINDYIRAWSNDTYYTVEWKKKDSKNNDTSGIINNLIKNPFDDNKYDRDFKFNESGKYIIEADVVERLCMRQKYRKVVEHNELEVIVVPGDARIRKMPFSEKLKIALEYADWEGAAYRARDMALMLAACSAVLGVIALMPLDEVVIVLAPAFELIGYGGTVIEFARAVYKLADFVDRVRNAQSEGALQEAGSIFAEAVVTLGIDALFAFLGRLSKMTKEQFRNRKKVTVNSAEDAIGNIRVIEFKPLNSQEPVRVYTDGYAKINKGKIDIFSRGKVRLGENYDIIKVRLTELQKLQKQAPAEFTKELRLELKEKTLLVHNYERSLGNNKVLANAGVQDTPEMNQKIAEKILADAKKVTAANTSIESRFKGTKKDVIIESKWIPNIEGPYCTTIIIKEVK